jgi:hypothetical protein
MFKLQIRKKKSGEIKRTHHEMDQNDKDYDC